MSLPDNSFLLWAQALINDGFQAAEAISRMYSRFAGGMEDPLPIIQNDDRPHALLIFEKAGELSNATILHHVTQFPSCVDSPTIHDGHWYATAGQPIGGNHITVHVPDDLFAEGVPVQTYTATRIQAELANNPDLTQITPEINADNIAELDLITTRSSMWIPYQYAVLVMDEGLT